MADQHKACSVTGKHSGVQQDMAVRSTHLQGYVVAQDSLQVIKSFHLQAIQTPQTASSLLFILLKGVFTGEIHKCCTPPVQGVPVTGDAPCCFASSGAAAARCPTRPGCPEPPLWRSSAASLRSRWLTRPRSRYTCKDSNQQSHVDAYMLTCN